MSHYIPVGAIRRYEDLQDLVRESRAEKIRIALHLVENGVRNTFWITPSSQIIAQEGLTGNTIEMLAGGHIFTEEGVERMYDTTMCLGDYNIVDSQGYLVSCNRHHAFTNSMHAENYVRDLQDDKEFQTELARHNAFCDWVDLIVDSMSYDLELKRRLQKDHEDRLGLPSNRHERRAQRAMTRQRKRRLL